MHKALGMIREQGNQWYFVILQRIEDKLSILKIKNLWISIEQTGYMWCWSNFNDKIKLCM